MFCAETKACNVETECAITDCFLLLSNPRKSIVQSHLTTSCITHLNLLKQLPTDWNENENEITYSG